MNFDEAGYLVTRSTLSRYSNNLDEAKRQLLEAQRAGYQSPLLVQQMKIIRLMEEEKQKGKTDFEGKQYASAIAHYENAFNADKHNNLWKAVVSSNIASCLMA